MDKLQSTIRLLALVSIFFIYKTIMGIIEDNSNEIFLWLLITIIYVISLAVAYFVFTKKETV